jgi:hypothetical protein
MLVLAGGTGTVDKALRKKLEAIRRKEFNQFSTTPKKSHTGNIWNCGERTEMLEQEKWWHATGGMPGKTPVLTEVRA